eukprot:53997-Pyramimonas_sp.AAC.1
MEHMGNLRICVYLLVCPCAPSLAWAARRNTPIVTGRGFSGMLGLWASPKTPSGSARCSALGSSKLSARS